jgi:hypothetical protein
VHLVQQGQMVKGTMTRYTEYQAMGFQPYLERCRNNDRIFKQGMNFKMSVYSYKLLLLIEYLKP